MTELGQPGSLHDYVLSPICAEDGSVEAVLVTARDITERKHEEEALQYAALHDTLTGLANRTLLNDRLEQNLLSAHRSKSSLALLFLDLDHFKAANDAVGHHGGDLLLQQLALRWSGTLREADTLSRLGGDEFVVLSPAADERGASKIASRLLEQAEGAFDIEGHHLQITASVGVSVDTGGQTDANELMTQADEAMYRAKREKDRSSTPQA
jgi:diguanylate cyclase (GGDEF)-like protein